MIAATAIAKNGARIVTCNTADFQFVTQFIEVIEPPPLAQSPSRPRLRCEAAPG